MTYTNTLIKQEMTKPHNKNQKVELITEKNHPEHGHKANTAELNSKLPNIHMCSTKITLSNVRNAKNFETIYSQKGIL